MYSFARVELEENWELREIDNVQGKTYEHIVFIILQIFLQHVDVIVYEQFSVCFEGCLLFSDLYYDFMNKQTNKQTCPFICNKNETLYYLKLDLNEHFYYRWRKV